MDQNSLVAHRFNEGLILVEQMVRDRFEIGAAFWFQKLEAPTPSLGIVSPQVAAEGLVKVYTKLQALLGNLPQVSLDLSTIVCLAENDRTAQAVTRELAGNSNPAGVSLGPGWLGDRGIEWAYIYPAAFCREVPEHPEPSEHVMGQLIQWFARAANEGSPLLTLLRDGSFFQGIPTELILQIDRPGVVKFLVDRESTPRVVPLYEIVSLQETAPRERALAVS